MALDIIGVVFVAVLGFGLFLFGVGLWALRDGPVLDSP